MNCVHMVVDTIDVMITCTIPILINVPAKYIVITRAEWHTFTTGVKNSDNFYVSHIWAHAPEQKYYRYKPYLKVWS